MINALDALLAGKEVATPATEFTGCLIAKQRKIEPHGDITYTGDVAAIVNQHCVECHREGELAPFTLDSYEEVVPWAATIREVVEQKRMPPWFADPRYGKFTNDCSLSKDEMQTLFAWIDNGCPEGDPKDLPPAPQFYTGWRMGEPDVVYEMSEPYQVPAEGTVDYQYFAVSPKLEKDLWVSIAEARPGNPQVVHHVVLFAMPPTNGEVRPEEAQRGGQMIGVYAPGMNPWRYPPGTAMKIKAGSTLVIQMHYTPNGTAQPDRSYVGLKLLDASEVKDQVNYGMVFDAAFEIPPHVDDYEVVARKRFLRDSYVYNFFPHMHYRGKSFKFEAEYPDGRREVLLDVPNYDFNWQLRYDLAEPVYLPRGSRLDLHRALRQFGRQPAQPGSVGDGPLWLAVVGRDAGRLLHDDPGPSRRKDGAARVGSAVSFDLSLSGTGGLRYRILQRLPATITRVSMQHTTLTAHLPPVPPIADLGSYKPCCASLCICLRWYR